MLYVIANFSIEISERSDDVVSDIYSFLTHHDLLDKTGIIYCATKSEAEKVAIEVNAFVSCGYYHSGIRDNEKDNLQRAWRDGDLKIIAATNAFAMGIDHAHVRYVIHTHMPQSIEDYYQQV